MGEGRLSVVFTGAGTSDYVGDTCAPYLRHAGNTDLYDFKPIATTDIVSAPRDFLRAEDLRLTGDDLLAHLGDGLDPLGLLLVRGSVENKGWRAGSCRCRNQSWRSPCRWRAG